MNTKELIEALGQLKVQTGEPVCLGCGHEHNCGLHGCAIMREAAVRLNLYEHALKQVTRSVMQRSNSCVVWLTVLPASMITRAAWMAIRVLHVRPASVGNGTEARHVHSDW